MRFEEILIIFACLGSILRTCQSKVYDPVVNAILADFNGDNKTDFLRQEKKWWDNDIINTADVFLSNGDGTFEMVSLQYEDYKIPGDKTNIYLGDFDGDGKADFLRQEKDSWDDDEVNTANVFFSNGDGTFTRVDLPEDYKIPGDLTNIYIGDFNGDGKADFLRQEKDDDEENTAQVFFSNGDGTFRMVALPEEFGIPGDLTNLYLGDFDGDGKADFLRQEKASWDDDEENTAQVFFSNGDGTFRKVDLPEDYQIPGDKTNIYIGDFDGDGKADFLRQEKDDDEENTAQLFFSNGDDTFRKVELSEDYKIPGDKTNIYIGDFDGNGVADFFRQEKGLWDYDHRGTADVFLANETVRFKKVSLPEEAGLPGDLTNLYFGDFDGDNKTDFLRQEKGGWDDDQNLTAQVFFSHGNGTFRIVPLPEDYEIPGDRTILHVADFSTGSGTNVIPPSAPEPNPAWLPWAKFFLKLLWDAVKALGPGVLEGKS